MSAQPQRMPDFVQAYAFHILFRKRFSVFAIDSQEYNIGAVNYANWRAVGQNSLHNLGHSLLQMHAIMGGDFLGFIGPANYDIGLLGLSHQLRGQLLAAGMIPGFEGGIEHAVAVSRRSP